MIQTEKTLLVVCAIFLIVSYSSCKNFDWEANPYVGDSINQEIVNSEGERILCVQPEFDKFTCFDEENISELKAEIERINMKKKQKKSLLKELFQFEKAQKRAKKLKKNIIKVD